MKSVTIYVLFVVGLIDVCWHFNWPNFIMEPSVLVENCTSNFNKWLVMIWVICEGQFKRECYLSV
jgi:hypothetical protein